MKVHIGKYKNYWGPYQIAEKIFFWKNKDEDDIVFNFGTWLATNSKGEGSWLKKFCEWINTKRKRKVKVKIDYWDTWNCDNTISLIIYPLLVEFAKDSQSTAAVDKADVPEELHSTYGDPDGYSPSDLYSSEAWEYVLKEMIFALDPDWDDKYGFGAEDYTHDKYMEYSKRQQRGHELFGKYLSHIWI